MCETANAVCRGKFISFEAYSIKRKKLKTNELILQFRRLKNTTIIKTRNYFKKDIIFEKKSKKVKLK